VCGVLTANSVWCSYSKQYVVFLQQTVCGVLTANSVWCSYSKQCVVFWQQTVCGVLTAKCVVFLQQQTVTSQYTPSRCSFMFGADNHYVKTKNCNKMPNNCFTTYIFHTDVLTHLPIQESQAFVYLQTAKIKTYRSVTLTHAAFTTLFT
jgi:hypothetical protein